MIIILISILLFTYISYALFLKSFEKKGLLFSFYITVFIFVGNISKDYEYLPFNYPTGLMLLYFGLFFLESLIYQESSNFLKFSKIDLFFFIYCCIVLLALPVNLEYLIAENNSYIIGYFIPVKLWIVYRIFIYLLSTFHQPDREIEKEISNILNSIVLISTISAVVSLIAFIGFPGISEFYNEYWPVYAKSSGYERSYEDWGRVQGTMSGTNGTGSFFALIALINLLLMVKTKKTIYMLLFCFYVLMLIISGSFSSNIAFFIIFLLFLYKFLINDNKNVFRIILVIIIGIIAFQVLDVSKYTDKRLGQVDNSLNRNSNKVLPQEINKILPRNLVARIGYWDSYVEILSKESKTFIFGLGPGGTNNVQAKYPNHGVPESFYFRILNENGVIGLIGFIIFYTLLLKNSKKNIKEGFSFSAELKLSLKWFLLFFLISGVANETLYYGGNSELFSLILFFLYGCLNKNEALNNYSRL